MPTVGELDQWKYCPRCAGEIEVDRGRAECPSCGFRTYASSKPTASAVCEDDEGHFLLSRRGVDPFKGKWDFPGGFLDEDEHPLDALRRELAEETGLEVEPTEWFGAFMIRYGDEPDARWVLNLVWRAQVVGGEEHAADDVSELRWFAPAELPPLDEVAMAEPLRAWLDR